jgi:hypothetical protein
MVYVALVDVPINGQASIDPVITPGANGIFLVMASVFAIEIPQSFTDFTPTFPLTKLLL